MNDYWNLEGPMRQVAAACAEAGYTGTVDEALQALGEELVRKDVPANLNLSRSDQIRCTGPTVVQK